MTINLYLSHSQFPNGIPELRISNIATRVRQALGDIANLPPHWGDDGKSLRCMTLTCDNTLNEPIARELSRMLQESNLGKPKFGRRPGFEVYNHSGTRIALERIR